MSGHEPEHHHAHPGIDKSKMSPYAFRIVAIRDLLVGRGLVTQEEIDRARSAMEQRSPALGTRLVARAWTNSDFKARLLADAHAAAGELGIELPQSPRITVLENTPETHHLVVCTLCSCYPRALLGRPPDWYKSLEYRSRAVREPRAVLREFGVLVEDHVAVRVVDSTADHRYLVLPEPPPDVDGHFEEQLRARVTRDAMIGAAVAEAA